MKIVFIAGPLTTGWDGKNEKFIKDRIEEARKYQLALMKSYVGCLCPIVANSNEHMVVPEKFYLNMDFEFVKRCNALLAMPGWGESDGATKEVKLAKKLKLPVFYPKSPKDIKDIIKWNAKN